MGGHGIPSRLCGQLYFKGPDQQKRALASFLLARNRLNLALTLAGVKQHLLDEPLTTLLRR